MTEITDVTLLSVKDLVAMTGLQGHIWTTAVADGQLGQPFLRSGAWQIRALDAVRFLKAGHHPVPRGLEGVDRACLVYYRSSSQDKVPATLAKFSAALEVHVADSLHGATWLAGRHLPKVVVLPLTYNGCAALFAIQRFSPSTSAVMIGQTWPGSAAFCAKATMLMDRDVLFLDEPSARPIAQLLGLSSEYMEVL